MSDRTDGRRARFWWARSTEVPQYRVHITAVPTARGWTVRLNSRAGVWDSYEAECATGWEAAQEVWEIMAALDVMEEWTMAVG